MTKHGYRYHPLYRIYSAMKGRCYQRNDKSYKNYGNRGIKICDEWNESVKAFIEWALANGYKKGLFIDRIDNDGDYCSKNCRFITQTESIHNTRLLRSTNITGYRGASYKERNKRWVSQISINGKTKHLGLFDSKIKAALRYDAEAYKLNDNRPMNFIINHER